MDFNANMDFNTNNALQCGLTDKGFNINSLDYDLYRETHLFLNHVKQKGKEQTMKGDKKRRRKWIQAQCLELWYRIENTIL